MPVLESVSSAGLRLSRGELVFGGVIHGFESCGLSLFETLGWPALTSIFGDPASRSENAAGPILARN
jgi:hypothetical protein